MLKVLMRSRMDALAAWFTGLTRKKGKQSKAAVIGFTALMVYALAAFGFLFWHIFDTLAAPFHLLRLDWLYFAFTELFAFGLVFIGLIFVAKAQLFEARDNDLLFSLPLTGGEILLSRLFLLAVIAFVLELLVLVPAGIVWAGAAGFSPTGLTAFLLSSVLLLMTAVSAAALFGWLISAATVGIRGNRVLISTLLSMIFLGAYMYVATNMETLLLKLTVDPEPAVKALGSMAPLYRLARAAADGSLKELLLSLPIPVLLSGVTYVLLSRSLLKISTVKPGDRKAGAAETADAPVRSVGQALIRKELRRLFTCYPYLMNSGLGLLLSPVAAAALLIKGGELKALAAEPELAGFAEILPLTVLAGICLLAMMSLFTAPSVSLEERNLWICRSLPVDTREILRAKLNAHRVVGVLPLLPVSLCAVIVLRPSPFTGVLAFVIPALMAEFIGLAGLIAGIRHPIFDWSNETQAVKTCPAVLIDMGLGFGVLSLPVLAVAFFGDSISPELIAGCFAVLLAAADVWLRHFVMTRSTAEYEEL